MSDGDPALTDEQLRTWASVATLLERLPAALTAQLRRDAGLTHFEFGALYALDRAPGGRLRMSTLAGYANATLSKLSRGVSRLEAAGLAERAPDPDDGRATVAAITPAGRDLVASASPAHERLVRELVFEPLDADEARLLGRVAERIALAIDPAAPWRPDDAQPGSATLDG